MTVPEPISYRAHHSVARGLAALPRNKQQSPDNFYARPGCRGRRPLQMFNGVCVKWRYDICDIGLGTVKTVPYRTLLMSNANIKCSVGRGHPTTPEPCLNTEQQSAANPQTICRGRCLHRPGWRPCWMYYHIILRTAAGAQCAPLRMKYMDYTLQNILYGVLLIPLDEQNACLFV